MRRVELLSISLENFRSFRKRATFELSPGAGLKYIGGNNQAQPRMGANGAGKSTLWDALAFCLYNASVKGMRPSDLASWGSKSSWVKTIWLVDGEEIAIERSSAPDRIFINAAPADQTNIDRLLGLSRKRFLQGVIFGQGVPLFIDLSVPERGALLDEVLDLGIWLKLSDAAGRKFALLNGELSKAKEAIARLQGRLEGMPDAGEIERELQAWNAAQDRRIDDAIAQVETAERELVLAAQKVEKTKLARDAIPDARAMHEKIVDLQRQKATLESHYKQLFAEMSAAQKTIEFYQHTRNCPTCAQAISPNVADKKRTEAFTLKKQIENKIKAGNGAVNVITEKLQALDGEHQSLSRRREFLVAQHATAQAELLSQQRIVDGAAASVEAIANAENPHQARLDALAAEIAAAQASLKEAQGIQRRTQGAALRADFWRGAFKRVRLFLVKRILAQLELETATAAAALGLAGWSIAFTTELENKSGTIKPGIFVQVTSPDASAPWEAWSGGEAQRIRLAVSIGLASMIQRLAGISIGFEVWDEPSAWLSPEGIEDLLGCLKHRVETTGKSLWLCDHRALIYSGFDEIWQVNKSLTGSSIELLSASEG